MTYSKAFDRISQDNSTTGQTITGMASHADGTRVISAAHGYSDGNFIEITGTTNYDGAYHISSVTTNDFVIPHTYTSTQTGTAYLGNSSWVGAQVYSGMDREVLGDAENSRNIAQYILDGTQLRVSGAQYMDPTSESLNFNEDCPNITLEIANGGLLRVGEERENDDGSKTYPVGAFVVIGQKGPHHANASDSQFTVEDGATFESNGGTLITQGTTHWLAGSKIRIKELTWYNGPDTETQTPATFPAFLSPRISSTDVDIDGMRIIGGTLQINAGTGISLSNITPERMSGGLSVNQPGIAVSDFFTFEGINGNHGSTVDIGTFNGQKARATNSRTGSELVMDISNIVHNSRSFGVLEVTQKVIPEIKDSEGNVITGGYLYGKDYTHGTRTNWTAKNDFGGNASSAVNYTDDREYGGPLDSDGKIELDILSAVKVYNSPAQGTAVAYNYRTKDGDDTDKFDLAYWNYDFLGTVIPTVLKGIKTVLAPWTIFADTSVTSTAAEAAAITGIAIDHTAKTIDITESHTLDDLYDYAKYLKTTEAGVKLPTMATIFLTPSGSDLDLADYAVEVSGSGVVLSPGTMFKTLRTTAALTLESGGTVTIIYRDSSGLTLELHTNPVEALLRIEEYDSAGTTLNNTYDDETSDSDGLYSRQFPVDAQLRVYQKKHGYFFHRTDHSMADGSELDLTLTPIAHIDTAQDLSGFLGESDSGIENRIWFDYDSTNHKGNWIVGEMNTSGQFIKTASLIDHRISTQDGLAFFAHFNVQSGVDSYLGGRPYTWNHDRLEINEDYVQFLRITGMTGVQISRVGVPVKQKDELTNYEPPESNNSLVVFDNVAILIPAASLETIVTQTQDAIERTDGPLQAIKTAVEALPSATAIATAVWNKLTSTITTAGSIGEKVINTFRYLHNKRKVSTTDNTETIYDDAKTSNLQVWDLKDVDGNAAVEGAVERDPVA